ncbi:MAG: ribonuclease P protein component [Armatimonadota bacterium]
MLPKKERLTKSADFGQVFRRGKGFADSVLLVKAFRGRQEGVRIGVSVSRRFGKAVARNRIRRRLREAARRYIKSIRPGYDVVLIAKEGIEAVGFDELVSRLGTLLTEGKLLCGHRPPATSSSG